MVQIETSSSMSTSALEHNAVPKEICETVGLAKAMNSSVKGESEVLNGECGDRPCEGIEMPWRSSSRSLARDGRSGMTEDIVIALRERVGISDAVKILVPLPDQRPMDAPPGWFCLYECFLTEFGIRFPVLPLLLEYAYERGVALSQLTHGVVRHMIFSTALAKAAGMKLDRELFERITIFVLGLRKEIDRASVGDFDPSHVLTRWVQEPGRIVPRKVNTTLKEKFRTLRDLSRETWADAFAETERKKKEKKGKAIAIAIPLPDKLPGVARKTGLRKRAPALVDDDILISDPLSKRMRSDPCELGDLPQSLGSLGGVTSGDFSSRTVAASTGQGGDMSILESGGDGATDFVGIDSDAVSFKWKGGAPLMDNGTLVERWFGVANLSHAGGFRVVSRRKSAFEKKIEALKGEVAKVSGLEVENNQLRDKITQLEDKACRDAENSIAEMARLRKSRTKWAELTAAQVYESMHNWYTPRLDRIGRYVSQRDAVEKAVIRIQVDEALLSYVRKIKGVEQDFDAVEKMLAARLRESKAAGDLVEDDEVEADDYAPP
ncbi:unnamed protein product [Microthlaspi erraticum]|uniref:Uncharacterized protein n=2 Tax=Microthlaspi erraticum TaxID=1685480 RepID=A0A6D2J723_9BRAS|nr:unnamed protein product [Microthlaspi erraticum]